MLPLFSNQTPTMHDLWAKSCNMEREKNISLVHYELANFNAMFKGLCLSKKCY